MSLSGLLEQTYLPKVAALQVVTEKYHPRWTGAATLEEQLVIEAEALDMYLRIAELDLTTEQVSIFEHPDLFDIEATWQLYEMAQKTNTTRILQLMEMIIKRKNSLEIGLQDTIGQVKRIKQKQAVLNLWEGAKTRFFTGSHFVSADGYNTNFCSEESCEIHPAQGLLTLPVQLRERVKINKARIGSGSNGQPGNSDVDVTPGIQDVSVVLTNSGQWFEYERMDSGPCVLVLSLELATPQLINGLSLTPADIGMPIGFEVTNIEFTSSGTSSSIFDLLPSIDHEQLSIQTGSSEPWELHFLPVSATSVAITLTQSQAYQIQSISSDGRVAYRDRYAIPISHVELFRNQFKASGAINSESITIPKNLYAVEPVLRLTPSNTDLYDFLVEVSFNGGSTWKQAATDDSGEILVIDSNDGSFLWRLSVDRISDAFSSFASFFPEEQPTTNVQSILKTVSRFNSPVTVPLSSLPVSGSVQVIQPRVARRGSKETALSLGTSGSGTTKLRVPFNPLKAKVRPGDTRLYIGGVEYQRKEPGEEIAILQWKYSDSHDEVILPSDLPVGSEVKLALDSEVLQLAEKEDGFYHKMKLGFDPDQDNIQIDYLAREPSRGSTLLPRAQKVVYLGITNILDGSVELVSSAGAVFTEVDDRTQVYDAEDNDYYVDTVNGIIYLAKAIGDDTVRAVYDYQDQKLISNDKVSVVYDTGRPWGIRIAKDALEAITISETVSDDLASIIDIVDGTYGPRVTVIPSGSTTRKQLSYDGIIKNTFQAPPDLLENGLVPEEVEFVDGITEFYGLTEITNEVTSAITAGSSGVVSFGLSARSLWYPDLGVSFSNRNRFATLVSSVGLVNSTGEYFIDVDGTVYVYVGSGITLPADIRISYYYKDGLFDASNKYSIDYENGVLYTFDALNQDAVIQYKTATYKVSYDVATDVQKFEYDGAANSVSVRTDNLNPINNQIKVLWQEAPVSQVSPEVEQFFSPLISQVAFRFS